MIANLTTQRNALKMLHDRVHVIVQYLSAVSIGAAPRDDETLRHISALVSSLQPTTSRTNRTQGAETAGSSLGQPQPRDGGHDLQDEFLTEYNDVLLTTYLATLTKQLSSTNLVRRHAPPPNSGRNTDAEFFFGLSSHSYSTNSWLQSRTMNVVQQELADAVVIVAKAVTMCKIFASTHVKQYRPFSFCTKIHIHSNSSHCSHSNWFEALFQFCILHFNPANKSGTNTCHRRKNKSTCNIPSAAVSTESEKPL